MRISNLLSRAALAAVPIVASLAPRAQAPSPSDAKPARVADPSKGYGEVTALTDAERATGRRPHAAGPVAQQILAGPGIDADTVRYSAEADGRTWASGATYKASFGADGFTYVPFLGSSAPANYPVRFTIAAVKAGGVEVAVVRDVAPVRTGDRVVFDRAGVREIYDLRPRSIEQTFVIDSARPGDLVVELAIESELAEDATRAGLQFLNGLGGVEYGTAFLVDGAGKREIAASFADGTLTLHVPAAMRTGGAVVIDPVISTHATSSASSYDYFHPDVAFDASTSRYLVVWERVFSSADLDVWCEMRDVNGALVPGSDQTIENSATLFWSKPRVANLNAYNRFLVVVEQFTSSNPTGQRYEVWGRTVNAASPFTLSAPFEISSSQLGDKRDPDVGGDPMLNQPTYWTVAYTREASPTDHDIFARQVNDNATPRGSTIPIEISANTIYRDVEISQSNGALGLAQRRWLLVYSYKYSSTDWDVYGAAMAWDGIVTHASGGIDTSTANHLAPSVSSAMPTAGSPMFGVTFEDESNVGDLRGTVVDATLHDVVDTTNLSVLLGAGTTYWGRIETDGCRFAVAYGTLQPAFAATLGVINGNFVVHEMPQQVGASMDVWGMNLVSRASAGGTNTGYALTFVDRTTNPDRIVFARYDGHAQGGFAVRPTGCGGLGISASGSALLGRTATATLTGAGSDLVGMLVGVPGPALTLCSSCVFGVNLGGPLVNLGGTGTVNLPIPCLTHFVGATVTAQGYAVGSGPCFAALRLSNSLDIEMQ